MSEIPNVENKGDPERALKCFRRQVPVNPVGILTEVLPSGMSMAMLPFLVDWPASTDRDILLLSVGLGSNPVTGRVNSGCLRVPVDEVTGVEFVIVKVKVLGRDVPLAHAQLRFLFEPGKGPAMASAEGDVPEPAVRIRDLIISWEAWRPPGTAFEVIKGLDPSAYGLTARAYEGAQRFLEDGLKDLSWTCYPLALPGGQPALSELLRTALQMGDAVGRNYLRRGLQKLDGEWDGEGRDEFHKWIHDAPETVGMVEGDVTYQLLERSCITMSLYTVELCLQRLQEKGVIDKCPEMNIVPDMPEWLAALGRADQRTVRRSLGKMTHWLANNSNVIPGNANRILEEAGLIRQEDGRTCVERYDLRKKRSPYGDLSDYLIE